MTPTTAVAAQAAPAAQIIPANLVALAPNAAAYVERIGRAEFLGALGPCNNTFGDAVVEADLYMRTQRDDPQIGRRAAALERAMSSCSDFIDVGVQIERELKVLEHKSALPSGTEARIRDIVRSTCPSVINAGFDRFVSGLDTGGIGVRIPQNSADRILHGAFNVYSLNSLVDSSLLKGEISRAFAGAVAASMEKNRAVIEEFPKLSASPWHVVSALLMGGGICSIVAGNIHPSALTVGTGLPMFIMGALLIAILLSATNDNAPLRNPLGLERFVSRRKISAIADAQRALSKLYLQYAKDGPPQDYPKAATAG